MTRPYRIRPGELLEIDAGWPQFRSGNYVVEPDGRVALGFFGRCNLNGMTVAGAEGRLSAHLSRPLVHPKVTVTPVGWKPD